VFFALWFWAILERIATDSALGRNLPETTWLFVVSLLSMPGALAWLLLGRPEGAGLGIGGTIGQPATPSVVAAEASSRVCQPNGKPEARASSRRRSQRQPPRSPNPAISRNPTLSKSEDCSNGKPNSTNAKPRSTTIRQPNRIEPLSEPHATS